MTMRTRTRDAILWLCFLALALPSTGVVSWDIGRHWREMTQFKPVEATIVESTVRDGPGRGANYAAHVRYRYRVGESTHVSDTVGGNSFSRETEEAPSAVARRYPPGSVVTAWYDPDRPARAVLVREIHWAMLALGVAGILIPAALLFGYYRRLRPRGI